MKANIKFNILLFIFCSLSRWGVCSDLPKDSIRIYLHDALDLMKKRSVNSKKLDWDEIYKKSDEAIADAKTIRDTYPAIQKALNLLNDQHSKFFTPEMVRDYVLGYRATGQKFPEIKARIIDNQYAYLALPAFYSYNFKEWNEFVDTFYRKMHTLQKQHPKAWILDLSDNEGGMFFPMLAAISPLLDRQNVIGWKDGMGNNHFINYKDNRIYDDRVAVHLFQLMQPKPKIRTDKVIVIINGVTASSAEFAAVSFVGQKNVSFFGTKTNGLTSANQEHKLSDGAFLVLTEGNTIDRNQKEYAEIGRGVSPDYKIEWLDGENQHLEKVIQLLKAK